MSATKEPLRIDIDYLLLQLQAHLDIPSPTGYTDSVVRHVGGKLQAFEIPFELTRRGALRARLKVKQTAGPRVSSG